jgi:hypothetical protein
MYAPAPGQLSLVATREPHSSVAPRQPGPPAADTTESGRPPVARAAGGATATAAAGSPGWLPLITEFTQEPATHGRTGQQHITADITLRSQTADRATAKITIPKLKSTHRSHIYPQWT